MWFFYPNWSGCLTVSRVSCHYHTNSDSNSVLLSEDFIFGNTRQHEGVIFNKWLIHSVVSIFNRILAKIAAQHVCILIKFQWQCLSCQKVVQMYRISFDQTIRSADRRNASLNPARPRSSITYMYIQFSYLLYPSSPTEIHQKFNRTYMCSHKNMQKFTWTVWPV